MTQQQIRSIEAPADVCWMTSSSAKIQEMKAELRMMERRGEVKRLGPIRQHPQRADLITVPYRRLRRRAPMRSWKTKAVIFGGAGAVYGMSVLWLAWESRFVLLSLAGVALLLWACTRFSHSGACVGLHCPGCRG